MSLKRSKTPLTFSFLSHPFCCATPAIILLFPPTHPYHFPSFYFTFLFLFSFAVNVISLLHITFLFLFSSTHHFSSLMPFSLLWSLFLFYNGPEQQFHFHRISKFIFLVNENKQSQYRTFYSLFFIFFIFVSFSLFIIILIKEIISFG